MTPKWYDKFIAKIHFSDDCWEWTAFRQRGYGKFTVWDNGRAHCFRAHRVAYELWKGPIPDGLEIDHLCRNPSCVRPAHLEAVTHAENKRRGIAAMGTQTINGRKTHCPKGHPYLGNNLMRCKGRRYCRECQKDHLRVFRALQRA